MKRPSGQTLLVLDDGVVPSDAPADYVFQLWADRLAPDAEGDDHER